jgi:hypothetical protein
MRIRVRRVGAVAVGGVALGAGSVVALGGLAGAQTPNDISVAPSSGAPGTTITVSGAGCLGDEVALLLLDGDATLDDGTAIPDDEGSWSGTLEVPGDFEEPTELAITASCLGGDIVYDDAVFLVDPPDEDPEPTTPTTTPTTTPPTSGTPGGPGAPGDGGGAPGGDTGDTGGGGGDTTPTTAAGSGPDTQMTPPPPPEPVVTQPSYAG